VAPATCSRRSKSGTRIDARLLVPREPERLCPDCTVAIGTVITRAVDAATLHATLS
jgi:hypothetical protein